MNKALLRLYDERMPAIQAIGAQQPGVSCPLFLCVPPGYSSATLRLMVVGQETHGWLNNLAGTNASRLMESYTDFDLGRRYRSTPFWQAAHQLSRLLTPTSNGRSFLWSNVNKVDQDRKRPKAGVENELAKLRLLRHEIEITQPHLVVLFTGPRYDGRVIAELGGVIESLTREIGRVRDAEFPMPIYRTYHPLFLRLKKRWHVLDQIAALARAEL